MKFFGQLCCSFFALFLLVSCGPGEDGATGDNKSIYGHWALDLEATKKMIRELGVASGEEPPEFALEMITAMMDSTVVISENEMSVIDSDGITNSTKLDELTPQADGSVSTIINGVKAVFKLDGNRLTVTAPDQPPMNLKRLSAAAFKKRQKEAAIARKRAEEGPGENASASEQILWMLNSEPELVAKKLDATPDWLQTKDDQHFGTLLHAACSSNRPELIRLLIERGAKIEAQQERLGQPLHALVATNSGPPSKEMLTFLLDKGADINAKSPEGATPILGVRDPDTLDWLLENGADPAVSDQYGNNLHRYFVHRIKDPVPLMEVLKSRGHDFSKALNNRDPLLTIAIHGGDEKLPIVHWLLDNGVDPNSGTLYTGNEATIRLLMEKGFDANKLDKNGRNWIHRAAGSGNVSLINLLVEAGGDINLQANKSGRFLTPLHDAISANKLEAAQRLVELGAKTNLIGAGYSATDLAQNSSNPELWKLLSFPGITRPRETKNNAGQILINCTLGAGLEKTTGMRWPTNNHGKPEQYAMYRDRNDLITFHFPGGGKWNLNARGNTRFDYSNDRVHSAFVDFPETYKSLDEAKAALPGKIEEFKHQTVPEDIAEQLAGAEKDSLYNFDMECKVDETCTAYWGFNQSGFDDDTSYSLKLRLEVPKS